METLSLFFLRVPQESRHGLLIARGSCQRPRGLDDGGMQCDESIGLVRKFQAFLLRLRRAVKRQEDLAGFIDPHKNTQVRPQRILCLGHAPDPRPDPSLPVDAGAESAD
ncbi:hypothetical protein [Dactylosporangium sp. NPDC000521]|uniref:hypothetical protein n=1 Tax=Dactylosporangium sp. NPDC000521 TaxID=3363975 RepID=UPI00369D4126